jgi:hypothetical protein
MRVQVPGKLVTNTCKKPVLIEVIVNNLLSKIDHDFIAHEKKGRFGLNHISL